jgi:hypothetical protein
LTPCCVQPVVSSCITIPFGKLFTSARYVDEPLLTLTPLYSPCGFLVRLACLNPAASVRSEPGSNSSKVFVRGSSFEAKLILIRRFESVLTCLVGTRRCQPVLDGLTCVSPEIGPERPIPFFSSPRLLRCQRHRISPVFPTFSRGFSTSWLTCGRRNM